MKLTISLIFALALAGCVTNGTVQSLKPVCNVLGPPHTYSVKAKSPWHAGPKLADRLDRDNTVGYNLPCPGY